MYAIIRCFVTTNKRLGKKAVTIGGEADCGALGPIRMCVVHAGVAAFILGSNGLDGELAVRQGGTEPDPSLVRGLNHGVAPLCERGHLCGFPLRRRVSPYDLLHLFRQTIGTGKGCLLAADCCLVAVNTNLCWKQKSPSSSERKKGQLERDRVRIKFRNVRYLNKTVSLESAPAVSCYSSMTPTPSPTAP